MVRASGKCCSTSSAMRSTPGPQATRWSSVPHSGQASGVRSLIAALMALQLLPKAMLDQPARALRALEAVAADAAERQRRIAAPVEEKQRLLAALHGLADGAQEDAARGSRRAPAHAGACR